jgi:hypothetical protein
VSRLCRKYWSLDIIQPYGPPRPDIRIALLFFYLYIVSIVQLLPRQTAAHHCGAYSVCSCWWQVTIYSGPKLAEQLTFGPPRAKSLKTEYSGLECTIEVVSGLDQAVNHIHTYGSGHTDVIVTQNGTCSAVPLRLVYSSPGNASLG